MQTLILYSTSACHLCDLAREIIDPIVAARRLELLVVDIANDDALLEQFGVRIPVVQLQASAADLGWPFDAAALEAYLGP